MSNVEETVNDLATDTGWVHIGTGDTYYRKIGKIVYVRTTTPAVNQASWTTIDTLPAGYRPVSIINFCLYTSTLNYSLIVNIKVFTGGEIAYVNIGQASAIPVYISFVADN